MNDKTKKKSVKKKRIKQQVKRPAHKKPRPKKHVETKLKKDKVIDKEPVEIKEVKNDTGLVEIEPTVKHYHVVHPDYVDEVNFKEWCKEGEKNYPDAPKENIFVRLINWLCGFKG